MTYREKLEELLEFSEAKDKVVNNKYKGGICGCPHHYFMCNDNSELTSETECQYYCQSCWDMQLKDNEIVNIDSLAEIVFKVM